MWNMFEMVDGDLVLTWTFLLYAKGFALAIIWLFLSWLVIGIIKETDVLEGLEILVVLGPLMTLAAIAAIHFLFQILYFIVFYWPNYS
jgi:hypothetical protein